MQDAFGVLDRLQIAYGMPFMLRIFVIGKLYGSMLNKTFLIFFLAIGAEQRAS